TPWPQALVGQADVVLRQRRGGGAGSRQIVEFRFLDALAERAALRETMEGGRHPPREALRLPDTGERPPGIGIEGRIGVLEQMLAQALEQIVDVARREVQALGAGRRHEVAGIATEKQTTEAQRFGGEGAERRQRLLDRR